MHWHRENDVPMKELPTTTDMSKNSNTTETPAKEKADDRLTSRDLLACRVGVDNVWQKGDVCRGAYICHPTKSTLYLNHSGEWVESARSPDCWWYDRQEALAFIETLIGQANVQGDGSPDTNTQPTR